MLVKEKESIHDKLHDALHEVNALVVEGRYDPARESLESLVNSGMEAGYAYLALGEICKSCSDESSLARTRDYLLKAIEFGTRESDDQVVVAAKAALAGVEILRGNPEEAERYLQQARSGFEALHELARWEELREKIDFPNRPIESLLFVSASAQCCTPEGVEGRCTGFPPICQASGRAGCTPKDC